MDVDTLWNDVKARQAPPRRPCLSLSGLAGLPGIASRVCQPDQLPVPGVFDQLSDQQQQQRQHVAQQGHASAVAADQCVLQVRGRVCG